MKISEEFTFLKYGVDRTQRKVLVFILSGKDAFVNFFLFSKCIWIDYVT